MTDEFDVPMNDRPDDFVAGQEPVAPAASDAPTTPTPTTPTPPVPPDPQSLSWPPPAGTPAGPSMPPAWGSAPQGWPPPPVNPSAPGYGSQAAPGYGQPGGSAYGSPYAPPPGAPAPDPAQWSYNYGAGGWGPPPGQSGPSNAMRRALALIAVIVLVLASAGVGAAISEAVHSNDNETATSNTSPFAPGNANNGNGFGNNTDPFGNGNGNSAGNGTGNGNSAGNGTSSRVPAKIVSKVNPAVVNIYTTISNGSSRGEAAGTGMVITSSGEVLTNNHVIDGARTIRVQIVDTGQTKTAKVLGYNVVDDIALLQIDDVSNLKTVSFADASKVAIGDAVVAIGNAGGRGGTPTATSGSVTALDQKVTAGDVGSAKSETLHGMIQISAPIEPGDSGGPLVDTDGNVIGMNTAAAQSDDFFGQSGSSVAFAIPIDRARQVAARIEDGKDSETVHVGDRGILGVQVQNIGDAASAPVSAGALVAGVENGSPADSVGVAQGDVITSINGKSVASASDLTAVMFPYHPDDKVTVGWVDGSGQQHHASVGLVVGPPD